MAFDLQHPDITHALNCGEDAEPIVCNCDKCGEDLVFGDKFYRADDGRIFCSWCMENKIAELGTDYIAKALGFDEEVVG